MFLPDMSAVAEMRAAVKAFLRRSGLVGPVLDDVVLALSELVTNAIEHGDGPVDLLVRAAEGRLLISVVDSDPAPAVLKEAGPDDVSGRGIALVNALADDWDSTGEETWCSFLYETTSGEAE
ncbi:ATP-binding protein [Streptomyces sp. NPDC093252]|uniref:ATP-binding protein n=1 Tax=Streptomyces sp. NPDC093252 TaxID=3154980 RepID=UPI00343FE7CC